MAPRCRTGGAVAFRRVDTLNSVIITVTFGFVFNAVQSNTIVATGRASLSALDGDWFAPLVGLCLITLGW